MACPAAEPAWQGPTKPMERGARPCPGCAWLPPSLHVWLAWLRVMERTEKPWDYIPLMAASSFIYVCGYIYSTQHRSIYQLLAQKVKQ